MPSFALLRLENELEDIHMLKNSTCKILNNPEDSFICKIVYTILVEEGIYKDRNLTFILKIPKGYPYTPPKLLCKNKIFHPNVDEEGRVCLEILREGWSCGYGLENIFINLYSVLIEPSSENPLNVEAGELMERDYAEFVNKAQRIM